MLKNLMLIVVLLLNTTALAQEAPAPVDDKVLGVEFGQTKKQVKAKVGQMDVSQQDGKFTVFKADKMPKGLVDAEVYFLTFYDNKLAKVTILGKEISDDPYGTKGKGVFEKYKKVFLKKYKLTLGNEYVGRALYKDPGEFWQCLQSTTCGWYVAIFEQGERSAVLQLNSLYKGGYYRIDIETAAFKAGVEQKKLDDVQDAEDAL